MQLYVHCTLELLIWHYLYVHVFICRRPSFSQKLSELAQHVDFREERADDDNEREKGKKKQEEEEEEEGVSGPTTKKPSHRWPWEFTHSKLKYINTCICIKHVSLS